MKTPKTCSVSLRNGVAVMTLEEVAECAERKTNEYEETLRDIGMYSMLIEEWKKEASYLKKEVQSLHMAKSVLEYEERREENDLLQ